MDMACVTQTISWNGTLDRGPKPYFCGDGVCKMVYREFSNMGPFSTFLKSMIIVPLVTGIVARPPSAICLVVSFIRPGTAGQSAIKRTFFKIC